MSRVLMAGLLAVMACGCGGTGSLTGVVTFKGKPVVAGRVTALVPAQGPRVGPIRPDGGYTIDNLPVGPVKLAVESPDPLAEGAIADGDAGGQKKARPAGWQPLPGKYADVATSGLSVEVRGGSNTKDLALD